MSERYANLNGLRAYAAIGIILMHVLSNGHFAVSGFVFNTVIPSFSSLTLFFMLLSAFSMCCGYYESFIRGDINLEKFYRRRYERIWPFFALLCTLELIINYSISSLYEWFADLTLAFGLLPNADIDVVGVGWFLGTVFVFYMIFPFFVFLIGTKKRAWISMGVTIILHYLTQIYFLDTTHVVESFRNNANIIFSAMFFLAGGVLYLYRNTIKEMIKYKWIIMIAMAGILVLYYTIAQSNYLLLIIFTLLAALGIMGSRKGIGKCLFQNRFICFIAGISMEIYLCHMFVYRLLEKLKVLHSTGNEIVNYCIVCVATIGGAVIIAIAWKKVLCFLRGIKDGKRKSEA